MADQPKKPEVAIAALVMVFFAGATLYTAEIFGHVTIDEVAYSDPAVNLVMNGSFASSAWYAQPKEEFWASNTPLHQILLAGWLKAWGFSIYSVRGFSALMTCSAGFLFWLFLRRTGLIAAPLYGYLFLIAYGSGYGMSLWMRSGRPDPTCLVIASLFCLMWNNKKPTRWLVFLGAAAAWAGLHLVVWLVILGTALAAVDYAGTAPKLLASGAGMLAGAVALAALYWRKGVLDSFANSILPHTVLGNMGIQLPAAPPDSLWPPRQFLGIAAGDYSIWVLLVAFTVFAVVALVTRDRLSIRVSIWCVSALIGTCIGFYYLGVTPQYYSWMLFVPLAAATYVLASQSAVTSCPRKSKIILLVAALTTLASATGIPRRIIKTEAYGALMSQSVLAEKLEPLAGEAHCALVDPIAYYAMKRPGRIVLTGLYEYSLSEQEKENCDVVIVSRTRIPQWVSAEIADGKWRAMGSVVDNGREAPDTRRARWAGTPAPNMKRADIVVLRRVR